MSMKRIKLFFKDNSELIKSTTTLSVVALVASIILVFTHKITSEKINAIEESEKDRKIQLVLPDYAIKETKQINIDGSDFYYWVGEKTEGTETKTAYAFQSEKNGYSGTIKILVGINQKYEILGLSILKQTETPGLGARCEEIEKPSILQKIKDIINNIERKSTPWFPAQYLGLQADKKIKVVKGQSSKESNEISAITGATITSSAITGAVEKGISTFKKVIAVK